MRSQRAGRPKCWETSSLPAPVPTLRWAGGRFDPEAFDPAAVKFDDPKKRWKKAFDRRP
jgi:hypothetical protein